MTNFINENYTLIFEGLKNRYSNSESAFYLSEKQIEGVLDYIENLGFDVINIEQFIDKTLINGLGFDDLGYPIEE